ncbi:MAG: hypothetical protein J7M26_02925 [Armatimonadetes bacterium]|nr:hypothetical protein [Armatimonadota bacterium]
MSAVSNLSNLWLGFYLAVGMATALLAVLLWYQAEHRSVERRRTIGVLVQLAASVALALALGTAVRALSGGEVFDLGRSSAFLGFWLRPLQAYQKAGVLVGLLLMALCFVWAMRAIRLITTYEPEEAEDTGEQDTGEDEGTD